MQAGQSITRLITRVYAFLYGPVIIEGLVEQFLIRVRELNDWRASRYSSRIEKIAGFRPVLAEMLCEHADTQNRHLDL